MYINISRKLSSLNSVRTWYSNLVRKRPPRPPYKHIIQIGDPRLRQIADAVDDELITSREIQAIIEQMKQVFHSYDCAGLAAPQIGVNLRIILLGMNRKQMDKFTGEEIKTKEIVAHPLQVFINPTIKVVDFTRIIFPESCESIKGYWADVPRYYSVEIKALNESGKEENSVVSGWLARIMQHEIDHLDGKMYTDLMDRKSLTCCCWNEVNEHSGRVILPYNNK